MSQNRLSCSQLMLKFEEYESSINKKYVKLLEINERSYRQIDDMLDNSLNIKLTMMRSIKNALMVSQGVESIHGK